MPQTRQRTPADRLERLAAELHELAFDVREQRSASDYERNEEEAQRIACDVRAVFRG